MKDRAIRRKAAHNKKERAKRIMTLPSYGALYPWTTQARREELEKLAIKNADHLKMCSCNMCGNQRRFSKGEDKLTIQEKKALQAERPEKENWEYDWNTPYDLQEEWLLLNEDEFAEQDGYDEFLKRKEDEYGEDTCPYSYL